MNEMNNWTFDEFCRKATEFIKYGRILDVEEQEIFVKYHIVETLEEN